MHLLELNQFVNSVPLKAAPSHPIIQFHRKVFLSGLSAKMSIIYLVVKELRIARDKSMYQIHPLLYQLNLEVLMELL